MPLFCKKDQNENIALMLALPGEKIKGRVKNLARTFPPVLGENFTDCY
jgi:hypothetical protein